MAKNEAYEIIGSINIKPLTSYKYFIKPDHAQGVLLLCRAARLGGAGSDKDWLGNDEDFQEEEIKEEYTMEQGESEEL